VPFPPIRSEVKRLVDSEDTDVKEVYVFRDPDGDPNVPVVLFFPLVNVEFRHFESPGVPRTNESEKTFADFNLFDNTTAYAIWRFVYSNLNFDRLVQMMEFNVLNNAEVIKKEVAEAVKRAKATERSP
jgi:phospholipase A2